MRISVIMVLFMLICPVLAVLGQQSQGEWEPFKDVKDQKRQELTRQPLSNESIIGVVKIGFSDDTIISMIQHEPGNYSLRVDDVIALKKAGVSEGVIAAMSSKTAIGPTPAANVAVPVATPLATKRPAQAGELTPGGSRAEADLSWEIPKEHGLYYQASGRLVPIEGQVVSFARTGSLLASSATFGLKSRKVNVQILGSTSAHTTVSGPVFYYRAAPAGEAAGGSAGDLVLVRMRVAHERRQFEVGAAGAWRASAGISIRSQLQVTRNQIEPGLYRLTPARELKPGEYALYLFRGYDLPGFVYDFSVE